MNKNFIIGGILVIIVVIGFIFFASQKPKPENSNSNPGNPQPQTENTSEGKMIAGYSGKVLAGITSPYLIFNKVDYDKVLTSGKVVFLDFYANWCPICRDEAPSLKSGFDSLQSDKVVGFRVNYNDSDTDQDEKDLAKQFSVPYQHTKVILKDGKEVARSLESWDKNEFIKQMSALGVN